MKRHTVSLNMRGLCPKTVQLLYQFYKRVATVSAFLAVGILADITNLRIDEVTHVRKKHGFV